MSDESFKFTPRPEAEFPVLLMRAFTSEENFVEWDFTPPDNTGWFTYKFEAQQKNGILYINMYLDTMKPKPPEYDL